MRKGLILIFGLAACTSAHKTKEVGASEDDHKGVETVVGEHMKELRACYYETLETHPASEGSVRLAWDLDANGKAAGTRVEVVNGKRGLEAIAPCLIARVNSWQFLKPRPGETPSVSYPLYFSENGKLKGP